MEDIREGDDHQLVDIISIRLFNIEDIDEFMVWATDDKVSRYMTWSSYTSKDDGLDFLKNNAIPHPYCRAICWNKRAIGSIMVTPNEGDIDKCRAELGYVLASEYWGKGIATMVVRMVVNDVFRKWPELERVEALVHGENVASQRVLEKVGFKREGVLRKYMMFKEQTVDVVMFSMLSTDIQ